MDATALELAGVIEQRFASVRDAIAGAAQGAGRSPDSVAVVVVTKAQPLEVVKAALDAGVRIFGENYAEEAVTKIRALHGGAVEQAPPTNAVGRAAGAESRVEWHMIGHIQSRKAKLVAPYFDLVHSLDSVKLAARLDRLAAELGKRLAALLEFNVGGEVEKHGWAAADELAWPELLDEVSAVSVMPNLRLRGLMTMPPLAANPEEARIHFRKLRRLRDFLRTKLPHIPWDELSMGTSADYLVAVEEGATLVRVGQAILGPRPTREHP